MERQTFITLMRCPWQIDQSQLASIDSFIQEYPWFGAAKLMRARALKNMNDLRFHNALRHAALGVADRKRLFDFLYQSEHKNRSDLEEDTFADHTQSGASVAKGAEREIMLDIRTELDETQRILTEQGTDKDEDVLQREYLAAALNAQYHLQATPNTRAELPASSANKTQNLSPAEPQSRSFTAWLQPSTHQEVVHQPGLHGTDDAPTTVIERFLSGESPTPSSKPQPAPADLARKSIQDDEEIVTETLARIYIAQKNFAKARRIYEKLILKFPEKSGYFASQIKMLSEHKS